MPTALIDYDRPTGLGLTDTPNPDRVTTDYAILAGLYKGLSGRDILNVCVNAIHAGNTDADPAKWVVTQEMIEREIAKAKKAKAKYSGGESRAEPEDDWVLCGVK
jgi:hypothetical protein